MRRLAWLSLSLSLFVTGCFSDPSFVGGADTDACEPGDLGCECFANQTCNDGLTCNASVERCVSDDCTPGALACPCDAGQCAGDLVCGDGLCGGGGSGMTSTTTGNPSGPVTSATSTTGTTDPTDPTSTSTSTTTGPPPTDSAADSSGGAVSPPVVLYFSAGGFALAEPNNARLRATQTCAASAGMLGCTAAVALISTSDTDTIAQLPIPPNATLVNTDGSLVAADLATFIAEGAANASTLQAAGVRTLGQRDSPLQFATGANSDGGLGANCSNWTQVDGTGVIGFSNTPGNGWLDGGAGGPFTVECFAGSSLDLLCACWAK